MVNLSDTYPLTPMQQALLYHSLAAPGLGIYIQQVIVDLAEPLDVASFEAAWEQLVDSHTVLRTSFNWESKGGPTQTVHSRVHVPLEVLDWRECKAEDLDRRYQLYLERDRNRGFQLSSPPLFRLALIQIDEDHWRFICTSHHSILDERSHLSLLKEVFQRYRAICEGTPTAHYRPTQFGEFVDWVHSQDPERSASFWRGYLDGFTESPEIQGDCPALARSAHARSIEKQSKLLPDELGTRLHSFVAEHSLTLNTLVQGAWAILLSRYTGHRKVIFGAIRSGRGSCPAEVSTTVGLLINTVPVPVEITPDVGVVLYLTRLRQMWIDMRPYEQTPLINIRKWSCLSPGTPLFNSLVVCDNSGLNARLQASGGPWLCRTTQVRSPTNYPFVVHAHDGPNITLGIDYDPDRYSGTFVSRMLGHLVVLLTAFIDSPGRSLSTLPLLTDAERHQLLVEWNDTTVLYPRDQCIHQWFEQQADRTPDAVAVVFEDQRLTYRELNERANQLAHTLQTLGIGPDIVVGVYLDRSIEMIIGILGILKAGGAYLPIDPDYPRDRITFMIQDVHAPVLVTQTRLAANLSMPSTKIICLDDQEQTGLCSEATSNPPATTTPANLAYVIFTSGSTGKPKGVLITHYNVVRLMQATETWFHFSDRDVWTLFHSCAFDFSVWEIWGALFYGGQLVVVPYVVSRSPNAFYELLARERVTVLNQTPSAFRQLIEAEESAEAPRQLALRYVIFGGEMLEMQRLKPWFDRHGDKRPQLINMYGITETTVHVTYRPLAKEDVCRGSVIGIPIPDLQIYILDEHRRLVPIGVPGEMYVGGAGLASGYLNRPELTSDRFVANPYSSDRDARLYKTGDRARFLPGRDIEYLGRFDQQIKIRGFRIELGEIESCLSRHPLVREAVVLAVEQSSGDKRLAAYFVPRNNTKLSRSQLRSFLLEQLPDYMVPSTFVEMPQFPRTPNGKLDRKALPAPGTERPEQEHPFTAPRSDIEQALAAIWADVLGLNQVGIHDNFFDLGGHSLLATCVVSRVRDLLAEDIPMRSLFQTPTIAGLAEYIEAERTAAHGAPLTTSVQPVSRDTDLPLSFAQQRLWFLNQLEPNSSVYNIPFAVRLSGPLAVPVLQQSLDEIVRRHEVLRTRFQAHNGQPLQVIEPWTSVPVEETDLRGLPDAEQGRELQNVLAEAAQQPFDLSRDLMIRSRLVWLGEQEHVLCLTLHHIAADGWSVRLLFRELTTLYEAFSRGEPSPLAPLPLQYADFAVWQREYLSQDFLEPQLAYWKQQLAGAPAMLALPTDAPRPPVQTYHGQQESLSLDGLLVQSLEQLSRRHETTLFMTLLAAFQVLLCRYTGQEDLVVGSPIAGRNRAEIENMIGFFVNTLALRTDLSGNPPFRELLRRVKETALNAYACQDLPFEKLVEELHPDRNLSYPAVFQVMFAMENAAGNSLQLPGLTAQFLEPGHCTAKFDLSLSLARQPEGFRAYLEYNTDLFQAATARRMLQHWVRLLQAIAADPDQRIAELPLLTDAEQHQLLVEWNDTARDYPRNTCVHELCEEQVARTPESVAVVFEDQQLTYRDLNARANQLAHYLRSQGVGPDVLVGVCLERSLELVVGVLGILKAGGAFLPLDPSYPQERLAFMLKNSGALLVLSHTKLKSQLPEGGAKVICVDTDWQPLDREECTAPRAGVGPEHLAYVIYTSGSTGQPKGAMIPHRAIANHMRWMQERFPVGADDAVLQKTPGSADASVWEFLLPLMTGARLVLARPGGHRELGYLVDVIRRQGVTVVQFVPSLLEAFLQCPNAASCRSLRRVFCGGEALTRELCHRFWNCLKAELVNLYGPTETAIDTVFWPCEREDQGAAPPIGRPVANTQVYVLDAHGRLVPVGISGELCIGGSQVGRGYVNRPELTAERFVTDPFRNEPQARLYRTGDRVRWRTDGTLEFLGRLDDQVKLRGFRIELGEIESVLREHPGVDQTVVLLREDRPGDKRLVGYYIPSDGNPLSRTELTRHVREKLPESMVPSAFVALERLPLTANGKVDRRALPVPDQAQPVDKPDYLPPRDAIEEQLTAIWADVLGLERVGIYDNFFELGGHSLLAMLVVSRANSALEVDLPLRAIFELPTLADLAHRIGELRRPQDEGKAERISRVDREAYRQKRGPN